MAGVGEGREISRRTSLVDEPAVRDKSRRQLALPPPLNTRVTGVGRGAHG
jgi:hypothetical protein